MAVGQWETPTFSEVPTPPAFFTAIFAADSTRKPFQFPTPQTAVQPLLVGFLPPSRDPPAVLASASAHLISVRYPTFHLASTCLSAAMVSASGVLALGHGLLHFETPK